MELFTIALFAIAALGVDGAPFGGKSANGPAYTYRMKH
jgi:hypothetical protein